MIWKYLRRLSLIKKVLSYYQKKEQTEKFIACLGIYSPEISMFFVGNVAVRRCRDEFQIFANIGVSDP